MLERITKKRPESISRGREKSHFDRDFSHHPSSPAGLCTWGLQRPHPNLRLKLLLARLLDELDQVLVDRGVLFRLHVGQLVFLGALRLALGDHDDAGGTLSYAGGTELGTRGDEDIRYIHILAQHGDVADHVGGADVAG